MAILNKSANTAFTIQGVCDAGAGEMGLKGREKIRNYFFTHSRLTFLPLMTKRSRERRIKKAETGVRDWRNSYGNASDYRKFYLLSSFLSKAGRPAEAVKTIDVLFYANGDANAKKAISMIVGKLIEHGNWQHLGACLEGLLSDMVLAHVAIDSKPGSIHKALDSAFAIADKAGFPALMGGILEDVRKQMEITDKLYNEHEHYGGQKSYLEPGIYKERAEQLVQMIAFHRERLEKIRNDKAAENASVGARARPRNPDLLQDLEYRYTDR